MIENDSGLGDFIQLNYLFFPQMAANNICKSLGVKVSGKENSQKEKRQEKWERKKEGEKRKKERREFCIFNKKIGTSQTEVSGMRDGQWEGERKKNIGMRKTGEGDGEGEREGMKLLQNNKVQIDKTFLFFCTKIFFPPHK